HCEHSAAICFYMGLVRLPRYARNERTKVLV
ncbi:MAG: hypothetical protein ACI9KN_000470, partial [Gammaproteobacteria bacterium]